MALDFLPIWCCYKFYNQASSQFILLVIVENIYLRLRQAVKLKGELLIKAIDNSHQYEKSKKC
jgi:hypothetical protein